ncbi:MAG: flagellar hook-basal body complex protein FliE [Proteocatella sp.]
MFINEMQKITSLSEIQKFGKTVGSEQTSRNGDAVFKDVFMEAVNNVKKTDDEVSKQQYLLATGQTDDVHNLTIAATKAQISVDYMVQLRNRAMESYSEIMRINF